MKKKPTSKPKAKKEKEMKPMLGVPEATAFVLRNITYVPLAATNGHLAEALCCIDGRRTSERERLGTKDVSGAEGRISFPGGGVGIAGLVLSALNVGFMEDWRQANDARAVSASEVFHFDRVIACLERALGGMSGHTDEHAEEDALACAGCGHAKALLNGGYGVGETYRVAMKEYLRKLKKRALAGEEGIVIEKYHGAHQESAALRLKCNLSFGEFLSVVPNDGQMSVFVFSEHMALEALDRVAGVFYEEFRADFKDHGISKEEFLSHVRTLYFRHVRSSAFKLAHNMPVYDVEHIGVGKVEVRRSDLRY